MTKDSAEEKIVQIGRKKMALDQALIESMDAEDDAGMDLESILKHGAAALFADDDRNDIHYDSAAVDKLLDRTQVENTNTDKEKTAESQFSFARVWANDKGALTEDIGDADSEPSAPNFSVWDKILKQREADAAAEAAKNMQTFGRGKRARQTVDYQRATAEAEDDMFSSPVKHNGRRHTAGSGSDTDFAGVGNSDGDDSDDGVSEAVDVQELQSQEDGFRGKGMKGTTSVKSHSTPQKAASSGKIP
jgi:chromodomain-helicase-DNA-binding protein 4